jgi:trans-aconitate methyltransferase
MSRRSRLPPSLSRAAKSSLDATLHPHIDSALKQLKSCARSLQLVLSTFSDELQILHRLYYKGKNQHRPALFWRRVTEMRRYADRVEELSLLSLVDSLRYSFFGEEAQQK